MKNISQKVKSDFISLLSESKSVIDRKKGIWQDIKRKIDSDSRYKAVDSSSKREEWFKEYMKRSENESDVNESKSPTPQRSPSKHVHSSEERPSHASKRDRERKEREEASIKKREEEVKETLASSLRERDKERDAQLREEALSIYQALLIDLIKDGSCSWKDGKRILEKDKRWENCSDQLLDRTEKETHFRDHVSRLNKKSKDLFQKLLNEKLSDQTLDVSWKKARRLLKDDPRYEKFSSRDSKRESEFKRWLENRFETAKTAFRELLAETKIITTKSKKSLEDESSSHLKDIINQLEDDKRFQALEGCEDERKKLIIDYAQEVYSGCKKK